MGISFESFNDIIVSGLFDASSKISASSALFPLEYNVIELAKSFNSYTRFSLPPF